MLNLQSVCEDAEIVLTSLLDASLWRIPLYLHLGGAALQIHWTFSKSYPNLAWECPWIYREEDILCEGHLASALWSQRSRKWMYKTISYEIKFHRCFYFNWHQPSGTI